MPEDIPNGAGTPAREPYFEPLMCAFSLDAVRALVEAHFLKRLEDGEEKQKALREAIGAGPDRQQDAKPAELYRTTAFPDRVSRLVAGMQGCAQVLFASGYAASAYRALVEVIGRLGPVPPHSEAPRPPAEERALTAAACGRFALAFRPSVKTAYYFAHRQNRTYPLCIHGLHFPEAMSSFGWHHDLPTRVLQGEGGLVFYPPLLRAGAHPPVLGTFRERERLSSGRVLGFRLAWGTSRVVVFLGWRDGQPDAGPGGVLEPVWPLLEAAGNDPDRIGRALRPLELAARYFVGWLTASGIELSQADGQPLPLRPHDAICKVARAARASDPTHQRERLSEALEDIVKPATGALESRLCSVHRVVERDGARWVEFMGDRHDGGRPAGLLPPRRLGTAEDPPAESICAVAASLRVNLLVRDLTRTLPGGRAWREVQVQREGFDSKSELAVPISLGPDRTADLVANVMSTEMLGEEDLWRTSLTTHLFEKLSRLPAGDPAHELVARLSDPTHSIHSFPQLSRGFCRWVREQLKADLVYLLIYDARVRIFRPTGITISPENARTFLGSRDEVAALGLPADEAARTDLLRRYDAEGSDGVIHVLLEHAVASRLLPRQHLTQKIFRTKLPELIADTRTLAEAHRSFDGATTRYARTILGVPFPPDPRASSDGVLWVCWQAPPADLGDPDRARQTITRLHPAMEAVAAMYAVFRYHAPDRVCDLLHEP
jgi:hypothetical protein